MGIGNVCVNGKHEGLYYIDWNNFSSKYEDENGEIQTNYGMQYDEWEQSLLLFKDDFKKMFKSFSDSDWWLSNEEQVVLENRLFYIVIEDNHWSMTIKLIQKEQGHWERGNLMNLQAGKYQVYLEGIKECLFKQFDTLGVYVGAWTSGTISKNN